MYRAIWILFFWIIPFHAFAETDLFEAFLNDGGVIYFSRSDPDQIEHQYFQRVGQDTHESFLRFFGAGEFFHVSFEKNGMRYGGISHHLIEAIRSTLVFIRETETEPEPEKEDKNSNPPRIFSPVFLENRKKEFLLSSDFIDKITQWIGTNKKFLLLKKVKGPEVIDSIAAYALDKIANNSKLYYKRVSKKNNLKETLESLSSATAPQAQVTLTSTQTYDFKARNPLAGLYSSGAFDAIHRTLKLPSCGKPPLHPPAPLAVPPHQFRGLLGQWIGSLKTGHQAVDTGNNK